MNKKREKKACRICGLIKHSKNCVAKPTKQIEKREKVKDLFLAFLTLILGLLAIVVATWTVTKVQNMAENKCEAEFMEGYCLGIIGRVGERETMFERGWCYDHCKRISDTEYRCNL